MCFGCSKEPSHRDDSLEYPRHMFWLRNKKNESRSRWYTNANNLFLTYNLYFGVKVTQNVAQYLQHNMTYAPVKFEVAMSNG